MIKNLNAGVGLQINNSYTHWPNFYNTVSGTGNSLIGQLRYNGSSQNLEVYDGSSWITLNSSYPTIEFAPHVQAIITWAQAKMSEEDRLKKLAEKHPAVADAIEAVTKAQEQLEVVATLVTV